MSWTRTEQPFPPYPSLLTPHSGRPWTSPRNSSSSSAIPRTTPALEPDEADVIIPSVVDRLDTQKLSLGIGLIFAYAGVSVYLLSPQARRWFHG